MDGSAQSHDTGNVAPTWEDVRRAVMTATEVCAAAAVTLALRGPHGSPSAMVVSRSAGMLADLCAQLRCAAHDERLIDAEVERRVAETLAGYGLLKPPPAARHLHAV